MSHQFTAIVLGARGDALEQLIGTRSVPIKDVLKTPMLIDGVQREVVLIDGDALPRDQFVRLVLAGVQGWIPVDECTVQVFDEPAVKL